MADEESAMGMRLPTHNMNPASFSSLEWVTIPPAWEMACNSAAIPCVQRSVSWMAMPCAVSWISAPIHSMRWPRCPFFQLNWNPRAAHKTSMAANYRARSRCVAPATAQMGSST